MIRATTYKFFLVLCFTFIFQRCAQVVPLGGGKRDQTPPKLIEAIPANKNVNYNGNLITLKFDEFVQLKDVANQLVMLPRLKTSPEVNAEGKKIIVSFKREELQSNTTYRILFGNSIADMHESNPLMNFEYIFSTGSSIDTIKISGKLNDALTSKPIAGALIGLYSLSDSDSLPYKKEPEYYTKSLETGDFNFAYLPNKTFKVYAISDKNKNSLYDGEMEKIAFLNNDLQLNSDTSIKMNVFQEEPAKTYIKKTHNPHYGLTQVVFNKKTRVKVSPLSKNQNRNIHVYKPELQKDTTYIYYKDITDTLALLVENLESKKADTLTIALPRENKGRRKIPPFSLNMPGDKLPVNTKINLSFLTWMDTSKKDFSKIKLFLKEDSVLKTANISARWKDILNCEINATIKQGSNYVLKVDSNVFFDKRLFSNDSVQISFKTQNAAELGKLTLKLTLNKKQNYLVQLVNSQDVVMKETNISFSLSSSNTVAVNFSDIAPGTYLVRVVFDNNANKKWDTGHLVQKLQPEKIIYAPKQIKILADWEIEEEILIKD